jgi:hypothetical protein
MHKMFITVVGLIICAVEGNAAHLEPHAIICLNPDAARHLASLDKKDDFNGVLQYFDQAERNGVCAETQIRMGIISSKNLGSGASKIFIHDDYGRTKYVYALTKEIKK